MGRHRPSRTYGYARVSTSSQSTGTQESYLASFNVRKENMFIDKVSGANTNNRKGFKDLFRKAKRGDIIRSTTVDRISRNHAQALAIKDKSIKKGITLKIGELEGLSYGSRKWETCYDALAREAELELRNKKASTQAGLDEAARYGRRGGRRPLSEHIRNKVNTLSEQGRSINYISNKLNISTSSVSNIRRNRNK